jgi:murein DD-endopeptidase MepM/ murein hydrolase activator NlpD
MTRLLPLLLTVLLLLPRPAAADTDPVGVWPLQPEPEVVAGFDPPAEEWGAGHRGVDLLGRAGQPVRAALAGTVSFAGMLAGRGVVTVDHGATRTTYEPVAATVAVGTAVAVGATIGTLQAGGSHCVPRLCLHWGWIEGVETYLDPLRLVGGGPVRLLPLWRAEPVATGGSRGSTTPDPAAAGRWPVEVLRYALGWACW